MRTTRTNSNRGMGCLTVIQIVLLVLKIVGVKPVSDWSWIWVLAPFWISVSLVLTVCIFVILVLLVSKPWKNNR